MSFNVTNFGSEIGRRGVAKPSLFYVNVYSPSGVTARGDNLPLRIESCNFPGRRLMTTVMRYVGPPRSIPYAMDKGQTFNFNVILSEDMYEREYFMQWQDQAVGTTRTDGPRKNAGQFDVGFYNDFIGRIEILQFAESPAFQGRGSGPRDIFSQLTDIGQALGFDPSIVTKPFGIDIFGTNGRQTPIIWATKVTLHEAYPLFVYDLGMDWNAGDQYGKLQVEMEYVYATEEHSSPEYERFRSLQDSKSMFRKTIESFQHFLPVASSIKNLGFAGAMRAGLDATGRSLSTNLRAQKTILPF